MIQDFFSSHHINLIQTLLVIIGYLMPIPLSYWAVTLWHEYRQERFIKGIEWVLLEIQIPREVLKTPAAMKLIFSNALYHQSIKGFWEQYMIGAPWLWFSLEIVSIDGNVHFFIRTPSRIRDLVETQIYAQYPQAKVIEVDDYAFHVPQFHKDGEWNVWGCEFTKLKEDFLPIKTWRNFGDDMKTGLDEGLKVDPITPMIEYLGSLPKGQQLWIQIIVRQSTKKYHSNKHKKKVGFSDGAVEFLDKLLSGYVRLHDVDKPNLPTARQTFLPEHLKTVVTDITKNMNQLHFDCGIRMVALADKKIISEQDFTNLRKSCRLIFRQYAQPHTNELNRVNSTQFDAPWSDPTGLALPTIKKRMLDFYRDRIFFHPPIQFSFKYPALVSAFFPSNRPLTFVVSCEELASLYHFPGMVAETPSFKRVESKIAKPPSNLPM